MHGEHSRWFSDSGFVILRLAEFLLRFGVIRDFLLPSICERLRQQTVKGELWLFFALLVRPKNFPSRLLLLLFY